MDFHTQQESGNLLENREEQEQKKGIMAPPTINSIQ